MKIWRASYDFLKQWVLYNNGFFLFFFFFFSLDIFCCFQNQKLGFFFSSWVSINFFWVIFDKTFQIHDNSIKKIEKMSPGWLYVYLYNAIWRIWKISFKFYTIIIRWFPPFSAIKYTSTLIPWVKASRSINTSLSNEMSLSTRNKNNLEPAESKD